MGEWIPEPLPESTEWIGTRSGGLVSAEPHPVEGAGDRIEHIWTVPNPHEPRPWTTP